MINALVDFSSSRRGKWLVVAIWFVATGIIVSLAPQLAEVTSNDDADFLPANSESTQVVRLVEERFPSAGTPAIIVFRDAGGLSDDDMARAQQVSDWLVSDEAGDNVAGVVSIFTVPQARAGLVSPDNTTMTMIVSIVGEAAEAPYLDTIERIRDYTGQFDGDQLSVKVSGPGGLLADLIKVFEGIDGFLLAVTGTLVLVLLILIYRSPVVALVPLVSVGWVFALAGGVGALLAENAGLPVNGQASGIMTVLLFGAGTDYCLFISSRYREELAQVEDKHEAMRRTMRGVGESILSAAGTILLATLFLLLASLKSNQTLGPLLAIAVAVMLLASLTLVPAILTILGRRSFWPFIPRFDPEHHRGEQFGIWSRVARLVSRRPGAVLAGTAALFLAMSLGMLAFSEDFDTVSSLPSGSESRQGFELLRAGFPAGDLAPTNAYVVLPDAASVYDRPNLNAIDQITLRLAQQTGVASVTGPTRPFGANAPVGPDEIGAAFESLPLEVRQGTQQGDAEADPNSPGARSAGIFAASRAFVSAEDGVARIQVVLDENPYSPEAIDRIPALRQAARDAAAGAGLAPGSVLIGGPTATSYDTKVANNRDERVVLPLILLAIGVVLALLLRSIVAPLYLLATTVVSFFATLGLSTLVFKYMFGHQGVSSSVPFLLFVFLVALGIDYNIYLMARVREESRKHGLEAGTVRALGRTGGVITSAGIILAGTFAALMSLPLQPLVQLGFAVAIGILLDTFVIRSLTVPAIVLLLGHWNWWPRHDDVAPAREEAVPVRARRA